MEKPLTYLESSHDAEHDGIQLFPFEGDLAEKWPYKHRGQIIKCNAFFNWLVLQFYQCDIMLGFHRSGHIYVFSV